jgi:MFS superfamily sulfate permease-like transporter
MSAPAKPTFLVDAYADPVVVRIEGRACFANSGSLKDFVAEMIRQGKTRFVVDFTAAPAWTAPSSVSSPGRRWNSAGRPRREP